MITVICGTNRADNKSSKVAKYYVKQLLDMGKDAQYLSLEDLPHDFAFADLYTSERSDEFTTVINNYLIDVDRLVFIVPEYNGGFPGVLKTFIDGIPPEIFKGKRAALVGVSSGKAGNLAGMEHLTGVLHYLGVEVYSDKPKLSQIFNILNEEGELIDEAAIAWLKRQAEGFLKF